MLAEKMAEFRGTDVQKLPHERLSDREFLVLRLHCRAGKLRHARSPVRLLAERLKTVSTYRSRLLLKMGLHNSAELLHYAFQHQLVGASVRPARVSDALARGK